MGFKDLFHRRKARADPQDMTSGSVYRAYYGHTSAGKTVTERSSMQVTAVYACVRVLAEAVASLPLHLYKEEDSFWETLMTHLLLWGNAYVQVIRNGKGEVTALYPLMPNRMTVDRDENGHIYYQYLWSKGSDAPTMKETIVKLTPHEVMQIPGLGFDGLVGYSPIAMAKNSIGHPVSSSIRAS